jgi:phospholipid/cholesterol/gamma-HCH transport system substrate-binding protein
MKITSSQKAKTGIFILAALGLLVVAVFLIGKQKKLFSSTFSVYTTFKTVSGLQVGNYVRYAGINVGTVNDISIINDTTVRVELLMENDVKKHVRTDSKASISSDGLMGDKLIMVSSGSANALAVRGGEMLPGVDPLDIDKMIDKFSGIAEDAGVLMENLAGIMYKVNNGQGSLGRMLNSDKMAKDLEATIASSKKTIKTIDSAAANVSEGVEGVKHNFLFRGYFKKKEKQRIKDSTEKAKAAQKKLEEKNKKD